MASHPRHVYATLLLSDSYLPGALVLAHSLRDAGTSHKLAVLVTLDSVSAESVTQLKTVYDYVFPVPRIRNDNPANLYLMDRADLHSAFTKLNLWKLTEFSKIVYVDADVVAYRAPDELFSLPHAFSAAPDIGWPDLFNTGVMVLTPNMGDYYAMMAMAERGISFDGADQGLINMHFGSNYHRLSFTYNVTPSAHYQYIPAYRHFQSSINMVHFIGSDKPWFSGRHATSHGTGPFNEMLGRWWSVYDRHYRAQETPAQQSQPVSEYVQYLTKGEYHPATPPAPTSSQQPSTGEHHYEGREGPALGSHDQPPSHSQHHDQPHQHQHHQHHPQTWHQHDHDSLAGTSTSDNAPHDSQSAPPRSFESHHSGTQAEARSEQQVPEHDGGHHPPEPKNEPPPITMHSWDAQRHPPPIDSKPEAINFPSTHYEMSQDSAPFVPPQRYPSPPRDMWYEVPKAPPAPPSQKPQEIFPWERTQPPASRSFAEPALPLAPPPPAPVEVSSATTNEPVGDLTSPGQSTTDVKSEPSTPTTPTPRGATLDLWTNFQHTNAWDEVPEIERYVEGLQRHRRGKSQGSTGRLGGLKGKAGSGASERSGLRLQGWKLTDFPSEVERPSLPVTPAPIHRSSFWAGELEPGDDEGKRVLPEAEGVPLQSDWVCVHGRRWGPADCICEFAADLVLHHKDPTEQLQKLAKQQSELLLRKLGPGDGVEEAEGENTGAGREIPARPLPFGSADVASHSHSEMSGPSVLSPQPVKGGATTSIVRNMGSAVTDVSAASGTSAIPPPSYSGPGAAWEKGEDVPRRETALLPTEEERDVLDT